LAELAACGCLFITSAVESLNDSVLLALRKGHTAADVPVALRLVRAAGIDLRPTLLPYTPWTALGDVAELFEFAVQHDLVEQIDPVQYTLRLLIPPGSAILDGDEPRPLLRTFEPDQFGWSLPYPDTRVAARGRAVRSLGSRTGWMKEPARRSADSTSAGVSPRAKAKPR